MKGLGIGRIVWYTPHTAGRTAGGVQAAIVCSITNPDAGIVNLHVFPNGSSYPQSDVEYSETPRPNTWRWPERTS